MHELSVAMSLVDSVCEAMVLDTRPIRSIHVRIGPHAGIDADALASAFKVAARESDRLQAAELVFEAEPVRIWCPECRAERTPVSDWVLRCSVCQCAAEYVTAGNHLELVGVEVDDSSGAPSPPLNPDPSEGE